MAPRWTVRNDTNREAIVCFEDCHLERISSACNLAAAVVVVPVNMVNDEIAEKVMAWREVSDFFFAQELALEEEFDACAGLLSGGASYKRRTSTIWTSA
jgi:hypothetical protein